MEKTFKPVPDVEALRYKGTPEKPDIKIFVSHRIDLDSETIDNPLYIPVRCGAVYDERENVSMLGDDTGENISEKRMSYCELTVHYWAWKNVKADYYGICHYRRYIGFANGKLPVSNLEYNNGCVNEEFIDKRSIDRHGLNEKTMRAEIEKYDVIAIDPIQLNGNNNYNVMSCSPDYHNMEDVDLVIDIIEKKYPHMIKAVEKYMRHTDYSYLYNCWILKKEIFEAYSEWLFGILEEVEKRIDSTHYSQQKFRTPGTLTERLWGIYLTYLQEQREYEICHKQLVFFKNVEKQKELYPAFEKNNNVIVSNFNNAYAPVFSTFLASVIAHSTCCNNYDVIILGTGIDQQNRAGLQSMVTKLSNFSIRFFDPKEYLFNLNASVDNSVYTADMYTRVLSPHILKNFSKILMVDADMVCKDDIANLFQTDLEGNWVGAVKDTVYMGYLNGVVPDTLEYAKKTLKLSDPFCYCNTGVLLYDCAKWREQFSLEYLQNYISTHHYRIYEQDTINVLANGNIKFLDQRWNVYTYTNESIERCVREAPLIEKERYLEARKNPGIIHYAAHPKPWWVTPGDFSNDFWKFARLTPFYEAFISMLIQHSSPVQPIPMPIQPVVQPKSPVRVAADVLLPMDSKRRKVAKFLVPRDSLRWKLCKRIYFAISPSYRKAQIVAKREANV